MPGTSPPASRIPSKQALLRSVQAASPLAAFFVPGCGTRPGLPTLPGREACPKAGLLSRIICPISGPRCRYPSGVAWHTGRSGRCPAPGPSCAYCPRWPSGRPAGSPLHGIAESLTYRTNTSNADSFSLISYIYRKIPEPGPNRFYRLSSLVAYPFSYPFFASQLLFPQEYTVVIENKNFSEKISLFSDVFLFVLRTELLLTMCPTWSAGVFFIYGHVLLSSVPDALPRIRAPPLTAPYSGQMPEASPGAALAVMRDAHVLNNSSTRLKRTFH